MQTFQLVGGQDFCRLSTAAKNINFLHQQQVRPYWLEGSRKELAECTREGLFEGGEFT
jgi:hypothetical protein